MRFYVDGYLIGEVIPPAGGFWELGQLGPVGPNIWINGTRMTPFDHPVSYLLLSFCEENSLISILVPFHSQRGSRGQFLF